MHLNSACTSQGRAEGEVSEALLWGTTFKEVPQNIPIKINTVLVQYFIFVFIFLAQYFNRSK